jgi:hypothetical protein
MSQKYIAVMQNWYIISERREKEHKPRTLSLSFSSSLFDGLDSFCCELSTSAVSLSLPCSHEKSIFETRP